MKKQEAKKLSQDIKRALDEIAEQHGVEINSQRLSHTKTGFRVTIKGKTRKTPNQIREQERIEFENAIAGVSGIYPEDFDKKFSTHSGEFLLRGYNTRAQKYPIIGKEVGSDKRYKFPRHVLEDQEVRVHDIDLS